MFDALRPPLMVLSIEPQQAGLFPQEDGYKWHQVSETEAYVSYKNGWTLPLSVQQKSAATKAPLLLVRDKGTVTAEGGNFKKGYAHRFVTDDGKTPSSRVNPHIFPNEKNKDWLLVPDYINAVWLRYEERNIADESGLTQGYYGTLIFFKFKVILDYAPSLDRRADMPEKHDCMYRVGEERMLQENWAVSNIDLVDYVGGILTVKGFDAFRASVGDALTAAGYR